MTPFFFGAEDRRLFGVFYPGEPRGGTAALLCNPYGQEAIRAHRLYRVLSEGLARTGVDVLRFDYFATGDSAGDDAEGELAGWARDTALAHEVLVQRSQAQRVVWLGARLGAVVAMSASRYVARAPNALVLWEGIFDGASYLHELARRHAAVLDDAFGGLPEVDAMAMISDREAVGFELGEALRGELASLSFDTLTPPRAVRCEIVERTSRGEVHALAEAWRRAGLATQEHLLENDFDWLAPEAPGTALVSMNVQNALKRLVASPT